MASESQRRRWYLEGLDGDVNLMASNLTSQVRNIAAVTTAVANGDLAKKITVDVRGDSRQAPPAPRTHPSRLV